MINDKFNLGDLKLNINKTMTKEFLLMFSFCFVQHTFKQKDDSCQILMKSYNNYLR